MNEKKMVEALARCDGVPKEKIMLMPSGKMGYLSKNNIYLHDLPDYLHDHNAMQRLIDGLDDGEFVDYWGHLMMIVRHKGQPTVHMRDGVCATCRQKAEAYLRAKGLWDE